MEKLVLERVKEVLNVEKLSVNAFSKIVDMPQTTINDYILEKRKCAFALIDSILTAFPRLSAEWLLRGVGEMYLTDNAAAATQNNPIKEQQDATPAPRMTDASAKEELMLEKIEMLKQKVQDKEEIINAQKETIANLNNHIADLRHTLHYEEQNTVK